MAAMIVCGISAGIASNPGSPSTPSNPPAKPPIDKNNCKNNVYLQGGTIENNGKLNVTAHEVTLYGGFSIEKGGVLTICNN